MPRIEDQDDLYDDQDGGEEGIDWRSRLLTWGLAGAALLLGFLIPYMLYLNHQVGERFGKLRWQVPTRVYARPLTLRTGLAMDAQTLKTELDAASYRDDGAGERPGTYMRDGGRFTISSRGFIDVDGRVAPRQLDVTLSGGQVASLRDVAELAECALGIRALAPFPLPTERRGEGQRDVPVWIQGVRIAPGDWLYADADGMVVSDRPLA